MTLGAGTTSASPTKPALNPELLPQISKGVARIQVRRCGTGRLLGQGTGFLIGQRVVMTARHVVDGPSGCRVIRVIVAKRTYSASRLIYWETAGAGDSKAADVATLQLDRTSPGYVFRFAARTPRPKTTIAVIGYPLGLPLSFTQGPLVVRRKLGGVQVIVVQLLGAPGSSGSAFLDPNGNVIGILQKGLFVKDANTTDLVYGLNLVRWWGQPSPEICVARTRSAAFRVV